MDAVLHLTRDCQLRCGYCYSGRKCGGAMSWEVARRAIDLAFAEPDNPFTQVRGIAFFGGEPLLEWDLLARVAAYARRKERDSSRPARFSVTTNGLGLSPERLEFLRRERFDLCFSMDGDRPAQDASRRLADGTSSFERTQAALREALGALPDLEVVAVVTPANVRFLPQSVEYLSSLGARRIILNPDYYSPWSEKDLADWRGAYQAVGDFFLRQFRTGQACCVSFLVIKILTKIHGGYSRAHFCDFGGQYMAVAPGGNIYPCQRTVGEDADAGVRMGDVFRGIDRGVQRHFACCRGACNPECLECVLRPRCRHWCNCVNYALGGDIARTPGIVCFHERLAIEVADEVASTLYAEKNPLFLKTFYLEQQSWDDWR
jgi:uncharacterized protein